MLGFFCHVIVGADQEDSNYILKFNMTTFIYRRTSLPCANNNEILEHSA